MKIAVLGGSFNPVHIGHLILADCVCSELGYDKVLFVPCYNPPHKEMADAASPEDRLEMVKELVKADDRFEAEDFEIVQKGISYTWDTVCYLEEKYKDQLTDKIGLIIGFDLAAHFDKWKNARELSQKARLILAVRSDDYKKNGSDTSQNVAKGDFAEDTADFSIKDFKYDFVEVHNPQIALASSEIRDRIKSRRAWRYLVSDSVFEYIKKRNLYGYKSSEHK